MVETVSCHHILVRGLLLILLLTIGLLGWLLVSLLGILLLA